jgi:3-deoxy-D-manno-octulosonic-acid transferase
MVRRFYRKALDTFTYFCAERRIQKSYSNGKTTIAVSGDTRFDRVAAILDKDSTLDYISQFKNDTLTIVVGSSWPKDEALLLDFINTNTLNLKFIIAPHNIKRNQIEQFKKVSQKKHYSSQKAGET